MGIWLLGINEGFFFEGGGWGGRIFLYNFTCSWCRLDYSYIVKILRTWIELFKFQVTLETLISNLLGFFCHEHGIQTRSTSIWIKIRVSLLIFQFIVNTKKKLIIDFTCTVFALEVQYFQNEVSSWCCLFWQMRKHMQETADMLTEERKASCSKTHRTTEQPAKFDHFWRYRI